MTAVAVQDMCYYIMPATLSHFGPTYWWSEKNELPHTHAKNQREWTMQISSTAELA